MTLLWKRTPGVYCVDPASADRVLHSIPAHTPPAGLFTLVTAGPTARSETLPVSTVVLYPDGTPHLEQVYLTHVGVDKLCKVEFKELALTAVDTVEVQLEWWADLCNESEAQLYRSVLAAQKEDGQASFGGKGRSKGSDRDKGRGKGKSRGVPSTVVMLVNTHLKTLVDSRGAAVFEAGKTCRHWVQEECIKVCTRVPKSTALEWLTRGLPSAAVLARDFIAFDQLAPYRKVWVPDRSALLNGSAVQILQSLRLALAGIPAWAVVRAPTRWGVRVHKDQEQACKAVLQPHVVFVPDSHHRFCVRDLPRDVDPESIVATLATEAFKPYLVSNLLTGTTTRRITLASSTEPADIVFAIKDAGGAVHNVLLASCRGA